MEDLKVFTTVDSLQDWIKLNGGGRKVSFVPTMGALHHGHAALIRKAFSFSDLVVVSIFVNPTQFNNKEDLKNYPRTLPNDLECLKAVGDVVVFAPSVAEMYPEGFKEIELNLGQLEETMEGKFRPGHFNGVVNVVKRLFDIVKPDYALFGLKDYQQLAVIKFMVKELNLPIEIVAFETIRENSGLASSSRNGNLSETEKIQAEIIYQTMLKAKALAMDHSPKDVKEKAVEFFNNGILKLEYLSIVDPKTLVELDEWVEGARLCIAAYCGNVRLIDNIELMEKVTVS